MTTPTTREVLDQAGTALLALAHHQFEVIRVSAPSSASAAAQMAKIISKLSPIIGNLIELHVVDYLNQQKAFQSFGAWRRQDPGFPDTVFDGITPRPGIEIKTWFPLATEITARFKDSQAHFVDDQTDVALLAWLPSEVFSGVPEIIDVCVVPALSVAEARDRHYHRPPGYLVVEPEDTRARTGNLQQTNTNGYKFQGTAGQLQEAAAMLDAWGGDARTYDISAAYQSRLRELQGAFPYRLDTNFAKMDRIEHPEIEAFKRRVLKATFKGKPVAAWTKVLAAGAATPLDDEGEN